MVPAAFGYMHAPHNFICCKDITAMFNTTKIKNAGQHVQQEKISAENNSIHVQRTSSNLQYNIGNMKDFLGEMVSTSNKSASHCLHQEEDISFGDSEFFQNDTLTMMPSICASNPLEKMSLESTGRKMETFKEKSLPVAKQVQDVSYFQEFLEDKIGFIEYEQDQGEHITLTIEEILEVLAKDDEKNAATCVESDHTKPKEKACQSKSKYKRKKSCNKRYKKKGVKHSKLDKMSDVSFVTSDDGNGLNLLSEEEENILMREFERDAWKLCTSSWTYLECLTEGIGSCV